MKRCITCEAVLPETEFWKQKGRADGLFGECKSCAKARNTGWYRAHATEAYPRIARAITADRKNRPMAHVLKGAKSRAKAAGIEFTITLDDVPVPTHCPVLGIPLRSAMGVGGRSGGQDRSPSIDRIDPRKGYTPDNVIVVSLRANRIKSDATLNELMAIADFYKRLADERRREGEGGGTEPEIHGLQADVSAMLSPAQEQARPLPARDHEGSRGAGVLPPLPMGSRVR